VIRLNSSRPGRACAILRRMSPRPHAPPRRRNRLPKPDRRRALELLAASRGGCTEAMMRAHGFTIGQMVALARNGLANARAECVVADGVMIRLRITEKGRRALGVK
jgi:hypothetical protein